MTDNPGRLVIVHTNSYEDCLGLQSAGHEPVECSFGTRGSVLGSLNMDHHGTESWREGVAVRAYRDHRGARRDHPWYVVTGAGDADATFAIAALSGLLPDGLDDLATLVNRVDTDPIGARLEELRPWGPVLLCWQQLSCHQQDAISFYSGVDRWRKLVTTGRPEELVQAAMEGEKRRVDEARAASFERVTEYVGQVRSPVWGFSTWYAEIAPVIVALTPEGNVTIGCRDQGTAERLFGPGGLKNVFPKLSPPGWGGREAIGGSPRGMIMTEEQFTTAARLVAGAVRE